MTVGQDDSTSNDPSKTFRDIVVRVGGGEGERTKQCTGLMVTSSVLLTSTSCSRGFHRDRPTTIYWGDGTSKTSAVVTPKKILKRIDEKFSLSLWITEEAFDKNIARPTLEPPIPTEAPSSDPNEAKRYANVGMVGWASGGAAGANAANYQWRQFGRKESEWLYHRQASTEYRWVRRSALDGLGFGDEGGALYLNRGGGNFRDTIGIAATVTGNPLEESVAAEISLTPPGCGSDTVCHCNASSDCADWIDITHPDVVEWLHESLRDVDRDGNSSVFGRMHPVNHSWRVANHIARENRWIGEFDYHGQPIALDEDKDHWIDRNSELNGKTTPRDNCIGVFNPGQEDADSDGIGDDCEIDTQKTNADANNDSLIDYCNPRPGHPDADADGLADDTCDPNSKTADADDDKIPDICDPDTYGPNQENAWWLIAGVKVDADRDGLADACDSNITSIPWDRTTMSDVCNASAWIQDRPSVQIPDHDKDGLTTPCDSDDDKENRDKNETRGSEDPWLDSCDADHVKYFPGDTERHDFDLDGIADPCDEYENDPGSVDYNSNGVPDRCDPENMFLRILDVAKKPNYDEDGDGLAKFCDPFDGKDHDGDSVWDVCDADITPDNETRPTGFGTATVNGDGLGDYCDSDTMKWDANSNGILDGCDAASFRAKLGTDTTDYDQDDDGIVKKTGCDPDDAKKDADGDQIPDQCEASLWGFATTLDPNWTKWCRKDLGLPEACDADLTAGSDRDVDEILDICDKFPDSADHDGDGLRDACDPTLFPDSDNDGISNHCDSDNSNPDTDGDKLLDGCDPSIQLLNSTGPANQRRNATTIPDGDGDGLARPCDTINGAYSDANAATRDSNGDGVWDLCDGKTFSAGKADPKTQQDDGDDITAPCDKCVGQVAECEPTTTFLKADGSIGVEGSNRGYNNMYGYPTKLKARNVFTLVSQNKGWGADLHGYTQTATCKCDDKDGLCGSNLCKRPRDSESVTGNWRVMQLLRANPTGTATEATVGQGFVPSLFRNTQTSGTAPAGDTLGWAYWSIPTKDVRTVGPTTYGRWEPAYQGVMWTWAKSFAHTSQARPGIDVVSDERLAGLRHRVGWMQVEESGPMLPDWMLKFAKMIRGLNLYAPKTSLSVTTSTPKLIYVDAWRDQLVLTQPVISRASSVISQPLAASFIRPILPTLKSLPEIMSAAATEFGAKALTTSADVPPSAAAYSLAIVNPKTHEIQAAYSQFSDTQFAETKLAIPGPAGQTEWPGAWTLSATRNQLAFFGEFTSSTMSMRLVNLATKASNTVYLTGVSKSHFVYGATYLASTDSYYVADLARNGSFTFLRLLKVAPSGAATVAAQWPLRFNYIHFDVAAQDSMLTITGHGDTGHVVIAVDAATGGVKALLSGPDYLTAASTVAAGQLLLSYPGDTAAFSTPIANLRVGSTVGRSQVLAPAYVGGLL